MKKKIYTKIDELREQFYTYDSNIKISTKTDYIGQLSQDIEKIIQNITKTEKEEYKNENNNEKKFPPISAEKFLITDKENKSVEKKN